MVSRSVRSRLSGRQRLDRTGDRVAAVVQRGDQLLQLIDAGVELRALRVDGAEHGVEVGDDVPDELVTGGEGLGERPGAGEEFRQRPAVALQQLDDRVADLVDLRAVETLQDGPQATKQGVEVQRRLGVGRGMVAPAGSLRSSPGPEVISRYRFPTRSS